MAQKIWTKMLLNEASPMDDEGGIQRIVGTPMLQAGASDLHIGDGTGAGVERDACGHKEQPYCITQTVVAANPSPKQGVHAQAGEDTQLLVDHVNSPYEKRISPPPSEIEGVSDKRQDLSMDYYKNGGMQSWQFIKRNRTIPIAFSAGFLLTGTAICFTFWLSTKNLSCPSWANNCSEAAWWRSNIGLVQGIVTFIYSTGLTAVAFAAHAWSEASIWPLLTLQPYTLHQIEVFLSASRGSIPKTPLALGHATNFDAGFIVTWTALITLNTQIAAPLVGYAFHQQNVSFLANSTYLHRGGTNRKFKQTNPPTSLFAGATGLYVSWAQLLSQEPMTDYQDWFVDKLQLADRGDLTARAVRLNKKVSCRGHQAVPLNDGSFRTQMKSPSHKKVTTRWWYPQLTVWVDKIDSVSDNRTRSTLVFAAFNGTIENGTTSSFQSNETSVSWLQAVACDIDIELVDDILCIGSCRLTRDNPMALSSLERLMEVGRINETALWLTVAPVVVGVSVEGFQPMYYHKAWFNNTLPLPYTTKVSGDNSWTTEELKGFINSSVSAMAQDLVTTQGALNIPLKSSVAIVKLASSRALVLVVPMLVAVLGMIFLALWSEHLHRRHSTPLMRLATFAELLKSSQTASIARRAKTDALDATRPSELGSAKVKYKSRATSVKGDGLVSGLEVES